MARHALAALATYAASAVGLWIYAAITEFRETLTIVIRFASSFIVSWGCCILRAHDVSSCSTGQARLLLVRSTYGCALL
eukprot:5278395-Pleurochrysis_carterae.AAC.2